MRRHDFPLPGWTTETEGETQRLYSENKLRVTISPTDDGQLCILILSHGDAAALSAVAALFLGALLSKEGAEDGA